MSRLRNKSYVARAPQTAQQWPEMPDLDPRISELDGGRTNAALQRWSDLCAQRVGANELQDNGRFKNIQTTISRANGYLESVWTMQAIAGPVVTGMTLFSASDPANNTTVSRVTFEADVFQIQTSSGNHKQVFSTSLNEVKLGDVLTIDLVGSKVYMGNGSFADASTPFYVDGLGRLSLTDKFSWDGLELKAAGWKLNATTLTGGNATIDSAGQLILGTSNDIVYISATDLTYRIWIGNVTAGSAAFRVTKSGIMTAVNGVFSGSITSTSGSIGGFTIGSTFLSAGSGSNALSINAAGDIRFGDLINTGNTNTTMNSFRVVGGYVTSLGSSAVLFDMKIANSGGTRYGSLELFSTAGGSVTINGFTSSITLGSGGEFVGIGANITNLNASNLASGTVGTARLGTGSATSSTFFRGDQTWATVSAANVSGLAASATTDTTNASNISSGTLTRPINTSYLNTTGTSCDIPDGNLRVTVSGSPVIVLNKDIPGLVINGNQVVGTRQSRGAAGLSDVVALLDAWGAWA